MSMEHLEKGYPSFIITLIQKVHDPIVIRKFIQLTKRLILLTTYY